VIVVAAIGKTCIDDLGLAAGNWHPEDVSIPVEYQE